MRKEGKGMEVGKDKRRAELSRRLLLVSGAGALVAALPAMGAERRRGAAPSTDATDAVQPATDRERRLAAVLAMHGPELGFRR